MAERPFQPASPDDPAAPLERAEGAALRDPVEQPRDAAAPRIATDTEPVRPTPDDALHEPAPDLTHGAPVLRAGALTLIVLVAALFLYAMTEIFLNQ
jgi:hypothetical protein